MKKIYFLVLAFVLTANFSFAQWSTSGANVYYNSGGVGIGVSSPLDKLDIAGTTSIPGRIVFGDGGNYAPYMKFYKWTGSGSIYNQTTIVNSLDAAGAISFQTGMGGAAIGSDVQTTRMIITQQGNVGIGTTTPLNPLQVNGNIAALAAAGPTNTYFEFQRASDGYIGARVGNFYEESGYKGSLVFETNNGGSATALSEAMRITSGGNVLIGQTTQSNASYILDVKGNVRANAITVNTTGADFVFAPSYKLLTLPELNNFIQKNHHLPEIASAKEMQANGLNLGDNQVKLLQKVEELTLYLIEKDEKIGEQQRQINEQEKRLEKLEATVMQLTAAKVDALK